MFKQRCNEVAYARKFQRTLPVFVQIPRKITLLEPKFIFD